MTSTEQFQQAFDASVVQIRKRFIDRAEQQVQDLDELMDCIESCPDDRAALEAATSLAHKISGVATTLGFPLIGELAQTAESKLIACATPSSGASLSQAAEAVESLVAELDRL
ncbi:hypothetical protein FTO60_11730 [Octadecabacter sp. SW4]|uniref:Hpt domain-containing protein n=1 Tax=Octadecabacter sp. SW4 TaxID=2602067 RepID=UPI0011C1F2DE|nr:Hpt domain-containing protein [Octadecabacter sp. SW4]QEE36321.1 hypothetical protein FTO60_11730 [Octadecabacter sp. SW4]